MHFVWAETFKPGKIRRSEREGERKRKNKTGRKKKEAREKNKREQSRQIGQGRKSGIEGSETMGRERRNRTEKGGK